MIKNLNACITFRNTIKPEDPVSTDLLSCTDISMLCKWLCYYVQGTKKESGQMYPAPALCSLLPGI